MTLQGRLLIFPVADLPALAKGKGNKLIQIPPLDLHLEKDYVLSVLSMPEKATLKVISGKRFLTLKGSDMESYIGARAKRGNLLPRGFQKVDSLEFE